MPAVELLWVLPVLTTLFDKSFLQSLSVDELVWFDQHFLPVICPVFYVETLADLAKQPTERGLAENEVSNIAAKFPEMRGYPCASHFTMAVGDLLDQTVPMDGRVPLAGGRYVNLARGAEQFSTRIPKPSRSSDGSAASS